MTTPLIEQEIYLLERYTTLEYFGLMRDAFKAMVKTGWAALDEFMRHLPRDYRKRHLSLQPDIVWGERVLPNLTRTDELLDVAYEKLAKGDYTALYIAGGVHSDLASMSRDYRNDWMAEEFRREFDAQQNIVAGTQEGIGSTYSAEWEREDLYYPTWAEEKENWEVYWEFLPPPETWPIYRLNPDVQVNTTEVVKQTGIYLPEIGDSCPALLVASEEAVSAVVGKYPDNFYQATLWTLIERVADSGGPVPGQEPWREDYSRPMRAEGGQPCPREGYWWSPADKDKARIFKKGQIMPIVTSTEYGSCYWLWSGDIEEK
jgi:hypothetical protein